MAEDTHKEQLDESLQKDVQRIEAKKSEMERINPSLKYVQSEQEYTLPDRFPFIYEVHTT